MHEKGDTDATKRKLGGGRELNAGATTKVQHSVFRWSSAW